MAVPYRRKSRSKSRMQRASNMRFDAKSHSNCKDCGEFKLPHHVCLSCGSYGGKKVLKVIES